jgi:uncharacterized RDD family membrane protein YckC
MTCLAHPLAELVTPCARCGSTFCEDCLVRLGDAWLCVSCKEETLRDVVSGAADRVPLARVTMRGAAYAIDRALFYVVLFGGMQALQWIHWKFDFFLNSNGQEACAGAIYIAYFVYEGRMTATRGQTLGKMAAKVRVVRRDGSPVTRLQAWSRALLRSVFICVWFLALRYRFAPFLMLLALLDDVVAVFTPERTALHDLIVRTRVYRAE